MSRFEPALTDTDREVSSPFQSPPWSTVAASAVGTDHVREGIGKQDAVARHPVGGSWIIAVADGAGSAPYSAEGAALAVEAATHALEQLLMANPTLSLDLEEAIVEAMLEAADRLQGLAAERSEPVSAFHTTLAVCVIDGWRVSSGQVGDGFLVAELDDGSLQALAVPQKGEYANETQFLTTISGRDEIETSTVEGIRGLAAMTDGLLRLAAQMPGYTPHPRFFGPLFNFARSATSEVKGCEELTGFLASPRVRARTSDDLTLVIAVRQAPPAEPSAEQLPT